LHAEDARRGSTEGSLSCRVVRLLPEHDHPILVTPVEKFLGTLRENGGLKNSNGDWASWGRECPSCGLAPPHGGSMATRGGCEK